MKKNNKVNIGNVLKKIVIKNKKIIIGVVLLIVFALFIMNITGNKLTPLEEISLKNNSKNIITYIEEVETLKSKKIDKYINYAMEYNYNEYGSKELSVKDMKKLINSIFEIKISEKQIKKIGITPSMLDKKIGYDYEKEMFTIEKGEESYSDIAQRKIYYYGLEKIDKKASDKFIITYKKYVISDPYKILNYYDDLNHDEKVKVKYDTTEIMNYLTSKGNLKSIKKYINNKNITKFGKAKGTIEIEYIVKNDEILINEITNKK